MKKHTGFILLNAAFGLVSANASVDCIALSLSVRNASAVDRSNVLELVSREIAAAPGCACEIVKAAIEGSVADSKTVAAIVQSAVTAAPEQMRLISQCAVAVAPDSLTEVQSVIALLDPNLGESANARSSKDSKAPVGEVAAMPNPLDFPGQGPVGPTPGGPGGAPLIGPGRSSILPFGPPINVIPPVVNRPPGKPPVVVPNPPPVTSVDQPQPPFEVPPVEVPPIGVTVNQG
jgi:hypothetical protein